MNTEPVKHHYIPQFILKNFRFDEKGHLFYYNKNTSSLSVRKTNEIFMSRNLYRDIKNSPDEPVKIERDMARFEGEVSRIINGRFLDEDEITITLDEDKKLKLFFAVMGFRSKMTGTKFMEGMSEESRAFYSAYQSDGDLADFWKRNLGNLVNCRSLEEVWNHKEIDDPVKIFFRRDIMGLFGLYFIVAEGRGPVDFIISDVYPTVVYGETEMGLELNLYAIFPVSPDRIILLASNGVEGHRREFLCSAKMC